jgi:hypothetical protein
MISFDEQCEQKNSTTVGFWVENIKCQNVHQGQKYFGVFLVKGSSLGIEWSDGS